MKAYKDDQKHAGVSLADVTYGKFAQDAEGNIYLAVGASDAWMTLRGGRLVECSSHLMVTVLPRGTKIVLESEI